MRTSDFLLLGVFGPFGDGDAGCPLWVKSKHRGEFKECPLYPRKRTLELSAEMSALCQKRTRQQKSSVLPMWIEPTSYSAAVLGTTDLDRVSQTFHERSVVNRLAQEADRSVIERMSPVFVVWVFPRQCAMVF